VPEPTAEEVAAKAEADRLEAEAKAKAAAEAGDKKLSQEDVNRLVGEARTSAKSSATKELLESLGVTDLDAAKAAIEAAKAADDAAKTEVERLTERATKAEADAEAERKRSTELLARTELKGALRDAGITPERIDAAMKLADTTGLVVDGTDVTGIPEVIEGVKALSPEWFGKQAPGAVDANQGGGAGGEVDFRSASRDELKQAALALGVKL